MTSKSWPETAPGILAFSSLIRRRTSEWFFGWLNAWLKPYPDTMNLKTRVHLRDHGTRPFIEIEPTDHPLEVEQRQGISVARVSEIYAQMVHDEAV